MKKNRLQICIFIRILNSYNSLYFRESQTKWYGKRGLNWHITVASYRATAVDTEVETAIVFDTIIHLFDNASQDARISNAILEDSLMLIKKKNPQITEAFIRSDNAGCFMGISAYQQ